MSESKERRVGSRAIQKRRWDIENRPTCQCGNIMARQSSLCAECRRVDDAQRLHKRRSYIASRWDDGMTLRQIAAGLDSTVSSVGVEMNRMRRDGWDLPYRWDRIERSCRICEKPQSARGLCVKHYRRWQRWGDPLAVKVNQYTPLALSSD